MILVTGKNRHVVTPATEPGSRVRLGDWIPGQARDDKESLRGFTLLEIMIVLLLIGIFVAIAIPAFQSVNGSRLKSSANQMMGLIRDTYTRAALSGKTARIVFDLKKREYWVEESADLVQVQSQQAEEEEQEAKKRDEQVAELLKNPDFKLVEDELGQKKTLPDDVYFKSIWIDRFEKREVEGQVALYFFPDGFTEEAQIVLSDNPEGTRVLNLVVEPLTGSVVIEDQELPIEK